MKIIHCIFVVILAFSGMAQAQVTDTLKLEYEGKSTDNLSLESFEKVTESGNTYYSSGSIYHFGKEVLGGTEIIIRTGVILDGQTLQPLGNDADITEVIITFATTEISGASYSFNMIEADNDLSDPETAWDNLNDGDQIHDGNLNYGVDQFISSELQALLQDIVDASSPDLPLVLGVYSNDEQTGGSHGIFHVLRIEIVYERPAASIAATVRNDFGGSDGGEIGLGVNASPVTFNSPRSFTATEGDEANFEAYDGHIQSGYEWVFNDNKAPEDKSEWEWRKPGQATQDFAEGDATPSRTIVANDDGATFANIQRRLYNITRTANTEITSYTTETVAQAIEGNSTQLSTPATQPMAGHTLHFANWIDNGSKANPRTVIPDDHENYEALYKGHQITEEIDPWKPNQRKIVRSTDGWLHMVYESMGHIWYEAKPPGGDWQFIGQGGSDNPLHLDENGGTSPSIDFNTSPAPWDNMVAITWQA